MKAIFNELNFISGVVTSRDIIGSTTVCNCLLGVLQQKLRDKIIPLVRTKYVSSRNIINIDHELRPTAKTKQETKQTSHGCLAQVVNGMFYSSVLVTDSNPTYR